MSVRKKSRWEQADDVHSREVPSPIGVDEEEAVKEVAASVSTKSWTPQTCRSVDRFEKLGRISEGAYGVVYRARDIETKEIVALKRFKMQPTESFPLTSLREIGCLLRCSHENIMQVREVVVNSDLSSFYLVMPYMAHDLRDLMTKSGAQFLLSETKSLLQQLLRGVQHLHENWIVHRDIKTSNILLSSRGVLKLADFGLARLYGDPPMAMTPGVLTLNYRAPEVLLGSQEYDTAVDMWAVGCVFAELIMGRPLFQADGEVAMVRAVFELLGTPDEASWPGFNALPNVRSFQWRKQPTGRLARLFSSSTTASGLDLLTCLLEMNPARRISAMDALNHSFFVEPPLPRAHELIQSFPSTHSN